MPSTVSSPFVKDGRGEHCVRAGGESGRDVFRVPTPPEAMTGTRTASATARSSSRSCPARVPSRSQLVSRISPAPQTLALASPRHRVRSRRLSAPRHQDLQRSAAAARIDREHDALAAERHRQLGQQLGTAHCGRVDAHLVGARRKQTACVVHTANAATRRQRNAHRRADPPHRVDLCVAPRGGGRDIEDHDLVSTLCFVPRRLLGGVSGVAQILKPNAFYDPNRLSRRGTG